MLRIVRARIVESGFSKCEEASAFLAKLTTNLVGCSFCMLVNGEQNG
jgi:hypothetical protein